MTFKGMTFIPQISLGNILTLLGMIGVVVVSYFDTQARIAENKAEIRRVEARLDATGEFTSAERKRLEARLSSVETQRDNAIADLGQVRERMARFETLLEEANRRLDTAIRLIEGLGDKKTSSPYQYRQ